LGKRKKSSNYNQRGDYPYVDKGEGSLHIGGKKGKDHVDVLTLIVKEGKKRSLFIRQRRNSRESPLLWQKERVRRNLSGGFDRQRRSEKGKKRGGNRYILKRGGGKI